jgi:hypothetical protein
MLLIIVDYRLLIDSLSIGDRTIDRKVDSINTIDSPFVIYKHQTISIIAIISIELACFRLFMVLILSIIC